MIEEQTAPTHPLRRALKRLGPQKLATEVVRHGQIERIKTA